ncbi:hypothetical protein DV735_g2647, partial [Chaetothyriales sp. CBS 134920]
MSSEAVALYISSLADEISQRSLRAASDPVSPPDFVTGIRRKYLDAVQANALARRAFAEKASSQRVEGAPLAPDYGDAIIHNRLSSSRQRRQHESLDKLSRHVAAFERLLPSSHPSSKQSESSNTVSAITEGSRSQSKALLRKLELAVFDARMRAESGRSGASAAQSAISGWPVALRLRGLRAVHRELTSWLEDSLAACAQHEHETPSAPVSEHEDHDQNYGDDELEAAYSCYILGRKSMAAAVDTLFQTLPNIVHERSREESMALVTTKADHASTVQQRVGLWQERQQSQLLARYAHGELEKESEEAAAMLNRLADESQLLPAYPKLVKLGGEAASPSDRVKTQTEAWAFASEAADACTSTAIDRDIAEGERAIDETMTTLRDLALLKELKELVLARS